MSKGMPTETKKLNMNFPSALLDRVDRYAQSIGLNRSSAIIVLVDRSLNENEKLTATQDANNILSDMLSNSALMSQIMGNER